MKNYPIYILFITLLFASCDGAFEQVLTIDLPEHESKIAMGAHFSTENGYLQVFATQSLGILDTANYKTLQNAEVNLYYEGNLLYQFQPDTEEAYYFFKEISTPFAAGTYRLEIKDPTYGTATAEQTLPKPVLITSAEYSENTGLSPDGERVDELKIVIDDPAADENFYTIQALIQYRYAGDTTLQFNQLYLESNDPIVSYSQDGLLFSDGTFNGKKHTLLFYAYNYLGQEIEIENIQLTLESVSEDKFLYLKSLSSYYDADGNPFAEPVVVHSNVENGYGIFTLSTETGFLLEL